MCIERLDHLLLTIAGTDGTVKSYCDVLRTDAPVFTDGRTALDFDHSKINLRQTGDEVQPNASHAVVGNVHLCLVINDPRESRRAELAEHNSRRVEGPAHRTGTLRALRSLYARNPGSLMEISNQVSIQPGATPDLTALAKAHSASRPRQGVTL